MKIPEDAVFSEGPDLIELIMKARKEAVARRIKADSIIINANMVYVPALFGDRPEMVCGLDAYVTKDELPDGYSFAVLHNCNKHMSNADRIRAMSDEELADWLGRTQIDNISEVLKIAGIPWEQHPDLRELTAKDNLEWLKQPAEPPKELDPAEGR